MDYLERCDLLKEWLEDDSDRFDDIVEDLLTILSSPSAIGIEGEWIPMDEFNGEYCNYDPLEIAQEVLDGDFRYDDSYFRVHPYWGLQSTDDRCYLDEVDMDDVVDSIVACFKDDTICKHLYDDEVKEIIEAIIKEEA